LRTIFSSTGRWNPKLFSIQKPGLSVSIVAAFLNGLFFINDHLGKPEQVGTISFYLNSGNGKKFVSRVKVEVTGVEPVTFCMPCKRSSQLS
jgi:hypothetical protein